MLYIFFLTIFLLLLIFFVQFYVKKSSIVLRLPNSLLNIFLLYLILGSTTFNNDWIAYEEYYDGLKPTYDLFYIFSFKIFKFFGLTYDVFYTINQLVIYLLVIFFINKFAPKYLSVVVLAILVLAAPNLSILLRYYTAFAFFLVAVYYLKIKTNRYLGYLLIGFSLISHFGAIILFIFLYVYKFLNIEKSFKIVSIIAFLLWVFKSVFFGVLKILEIGSFSLYIEDESSFKGGVFASLPYLPWIFFIYARHFYLLKRNPAIKEDEKYLFLYKLSLFPFLFILLALSIQIIVTRYVEPFIVVWCSFLCYSVRFSERRVSKYLLVIGIIFVTVLSFYSKYFLPLRLLGASEWLVHYLEILNSNKFEIFKINDF